MPSEKCLPNSFVKQLHASEFRLIQTISHECKLIKGEYAFTADQSDRSVYIMLTGRIKISRMSQLGNEMIQWFCMPGDIFGVSDENNLSNKVYAQAITDCVILKIKKTDFNQLMLEKPRLSLLVIDQLSSRIHALGDMVLYMASDSVNVRFVKLIQYLSNNYGQASDNSIHIDIPTTHQDIADMIGACRQTVSGIISEYKRAGIVDINRKGMHVHKPKQLSNLLKH